MEVTAVQTSVDVESGPEASTPEPMEETIQIASALAGGTGVGVTDHSQTHRSDAAADETIDRRICDELSLDDLDRLEALLERFDAAWKGGSRPDIEAYLAGSDAHFLDLLVDLIRLDQHHRWKSDQPMPVESYLQRFPILRDHPAAQLDLVLAEYQIEASERGSADREAYLDRFPDLREKLSSRLGQAPSSRRWLPTRLNCPHCHNAIAVVDSDESYDLACPSCGESLRIDPDRTRSWTPDTSTRLGKFQLLQSVGHGAFGTVYKAEDTDLHRIVALKVPRRGAFSTADDVEQFISEARHAAQLSHPGIVQVFDAHRSEQFPYIVTEFIDGVTLQDVLTAKRYTFREAAELVRKLAEAVHHAHERGVVHRDLKPGNVMIDEDGQPRVMDFGLAKLQTPEVTVTTGGKILGTPAYMSPEQARGRSQSADARADVYSLGVMLFELLTGDRPFRGNSMMLLHQVIHEDPPSPRKLNDRIPRDLETIGLKCMEKKPERRYATAGALAEDLRRHLSNEPIQARPLRPPERAWRWCRRNTTLATSAAVIFLMLTATLSIVAYSWRREATAHETARRLAARNQQLYVQEQAARRGETEARLRAESSRQEALRRLRQARAAVDLWLTEFASAMQYFPNIAPTRKRVLEQAAEDYERFAAESQNDPDLELERGRTWVRVGDVRRLLGEDEEALTAYRKAELILEELVESPLDQVVVVVELAKVRTSIALAARMLERNSEAAMLFEESISELSQLNPVRRRRTDVQSAWATLLSNQAALLMELGNVDEGLQVAHDALRRFEALRDASEETNTIIDAHARTRGIAAQLEQRAGRWVAALEHANQAVNLTNDLVEREPDNVDFRASRANLQLVRAGALRQLGRVRDEAACYEANLADFEAMIDAHPDIPAHRVSHALCHLDLANLLQEDGRPRTAEQHLVTAIESLLQLATEFPRPQMYEYLSAARSLLGEVYRDVSQIADSEQSLRSAASVLQQLATAVPEVIGYRHQLAVTQGQLAQTLWAAGDITEALAMFEASLSALQSLSTDHPRHTEYLDQLAMVAWRYAEAELEQGQAEKARALFDQAETAFDARLQLDRSAAALERKARYLISCDDTSRRDAETAVRLASQAVTEAPEHRRSRTTWAAALWRAGRGGEAVEELRSLQEAEQLDGIAHLTLAMSRHHMQEMAPARTHLTAGEAWIRENRSGNRKVAQWLTEARELIGEE